MNCCFIKKKRIIPKISETHVKKEEIRHSSKKILDECIINLSYLTMKVKEVENDDVISTLTSKSDQIKNNSYKT